MGVQERDGAGGEGRGEGRVGSGVEERAKAGRWAMDRLRQQGKTVGGYLWKGAQ